MQAGKNSSVWGSGSAHELCLANKPRASGSSPWCLSQHQTPLQSQGLDLLGEWCCSIGNEGRHLGLKAWAKPPSIRPPAPSSSSLPTGSLLSGRCHANKNDQTRMGLCWGFPMLSSPDPAQPGTAWGEPKPRRALKEGHMPGPNVRGGCNCGVSSDIMKRRGFPAPGRSLKKMKGGGIHLHLRGWVQGCPWVRICSVHPGCNSGWGYTIARSPAAFDPLTSNCNRKQRPRAAVVGCLPLARPAPARHAPTLHLHARVQVP